MVTNALARGGPDPSFPAASPDTSRVYNGTTALFPLFAVVTATATGAVIAPVGGLIIRILSMDLVASNAMTVSWQSSGGTTISGPQSYAANGGIVRPFNQAGWFQTLPGEGLNINITGTGTIGGDITYVAL